MKLKELDIDDYAYINKFHFLWSMKHQVLRKAR